MIRIARFVFNPFGEQTYVVHDEATHEAAIIDPGCVTHREWAALHGYIDEQGLDVRHVLLTHSHLDHVAGTGLCARAYGVGISGSLDDQLALPTPREQAFLFGLEKEFGWGNQSVPGASLIAQVPPVAVVNRLADGSRIQLGSHIVDVIDVPGHSPHGLCFFFATEGAVFVGDVLFCGSVGRTDFGERFGCSHRALIEGITQRLLALPSDVVVYPGHGPQTTIGTEATHNPYL